MAFTNITNLWLRDNIWLTIKGGVHTTAVRSFRLCVSESWPLITGGMLRLGVGTLLFFSPGTILWKKFVGD